MTLTKQGLRDYSSPQNGRSRDSKTELREQHAACSKRRNHEYCGRINKCSECGFWESWPSL